MAKIDDSTENFKTSPLGFLMSVLAKYSAFVGRSLLAQPDAELSSKNEKAKDALNNIKIELAQNTGLKNQVSNEAVLMTVMEAFPKSEQDSILETIFDYLNILDGTLATAGTESENGRALINEFYDVSRLGLILNCYLGQFDNDDFFYGSLAAALEAVSAHYKNAAQTSGAGSASSQRLESAASQASGKAIITLCDSLTSKIEKAGIDLAFTDFLAHIYNSLSAADKNLLYSSIIKPYADSLLEKIITQTPDQEDGGRLACIKQIQRQLEKLM